MFLRPARREHKKRHKLATCTLVFFLFFYWRQSATVGPMITPGIDFILRTLTRLVVPPIFLSVSVRVLFRVCGDYTVPTWALISTVLLGIPLFPVVGMVGTRLYHKHQARKLGARLAPEVKGKRIGNFDVVKKLSTYLDGYLAERMLELHDELGPVCNARMSWSDLILTTSPETMKRMLATDSTNFVKGIRFHDTMFPVLGNGVFNVDGDMWKLHRSMTRPFFSRERISDFDIFDEHANMSISLMRDRFHGGHAIDFQDLMSRFTLDCASAFLFGHCVNSLETALPYPHNALIPSTKRAEIEDSKASVFARQFLVAQEIVALREFSGWTWPLFEMWGDKTKEPMRLVRDFVDPIVKEAIERRNRKRAATGEKETEGVVEGETLLDHLVKLTFDPVTIRDETLNIMIAGRDTTAAALSFVVYFLAMHPAVLTRLREEILSIVGATRRPDYGDIRDMKYLTAVINETLRLFPPVPVNMREAVNATIWPSPDPSQPPIYIPAGTKVFYPIFLMQRRKDVWGPDAEEFDPDRFLDGRLDKDVINDPFNFLPFGSGPRICLGQQFAYNEISFMVIRLLQQFTSIALDLEACPPEDRPKPEWKERQGRMAIEQVFPQSHLTTFVKGGLWLRMKEAESE